MFHALMIIRKRKNFRIYFWKNNFCSWTNNIVQNFEIELDIFSLKFVLVPKKVPLVSVLNFRYQYRTDSNVNGTQL